TSEATAITSGAIALILQRFPTLTPDGVKAFIESDARRLDRVDDRDQGAGALDLVGMLGDAPRGGRGGQASARQHYPDSSGGGTVEGARGSDHVSLDGTPLVGEVDIFGHPFDAAQIAQAEASGDAWSGGIWNGSTWSGSAWSGSTWSGSTWSGSTWSG